MFFSLKLFIFQSSTFHVLHIFALKSTKKYLATWLCVVKTHTHTIILDHHWIFNTDHEIIKFHVLFHLKTFYISSLSNKKKYMCLQRKQLYNIKYLIHAGDKIKTDIFLCNFFWKHKKKKFYKTVHIIKFWQFHLGTKKWNHCRISEQIQLLLWQHIHNIYFLFSFSVFFF